MVANPEYMRTSYDIVSRASQGLTNALSLYGEMPRMKYEKQKAEEQQAYTRGMQERAEKRAEEKHSMDMTQDEQQATSRHLDNAMKLLKLGGTPAAMQYLDKFVPGHGITPIGATKSGAALFNFKGRGGSGDSVLAVDPKTGSVYPPGTFDEATGVMTPQGREYFSRLPRKEQVKLQAREAAEIRAAKAGGKTGPAKGKVVWQNGIPYMETTDASGRPSIQMIPVDYGDGAAAPPAGSPAPPAASAPLPLPAGSPPTYRPGVPAAPAAPPSSPFSGQLPVGRRPGDPGVPVGGKRGSVLRETGPAIPPPETRKPITPIYGGAR